MLAQTLTPHPAPHLWTAAERNSVPEIYLPENERDYLSQ